MSGEREQPFYFDIKHIGTEIDNEGNIEIDIVHDDKFVDYVKAELGVELFDNEAIKKFLMNLVYSYCGKSNQ